MSETTPLESEFDGLYASEPTVLPFDGALQIRAFVLRRPAGNLGIYSIDGLRRHASAIDDLGGVSRQYLNHWHEAMFASDRISAPLFVHDNDSASVAERTHVDGTFSTRHSLEDDFEIIPIPGHTEGATAYLWDSGESRFLFTGDSILIKEGEWIAAVLESSDRESYIASLELIRDLDFDVLVPWAASVGGPYFTATTRTEAHVRLSAILERLRRGENY